MAAIGQRNDVRYRFLVMPFICYVPLGIGLCHWAWRDAAVPSAAKPALVALGMLGWTLIEYLLHRYLLHFRPRTSALAALVDMLHLGHHRHPRDEAKITVPVFASLPIAAGLLGLFRLLTGSWQGAALLLGGTIAGYLSYELVHFRIHCSTRRGRWLQRVRVHHFSHHFEDPTGCFGVTTPLWDLAFGTGRGRIRTTGGSTSELSPLRPLTRGAILFFPLTPALSRPGRGGQISPPVNAEAGTGAGGVK